MKKDKETIGKKLRQLRRGKRMTQEEVADAVSITRSTISNYEIGRRTPHLKELQRIAAFFGVGLDYFGMTPTDEIYDLLTRAKEVFESEEVPTDVKEELYREFMRLYLNLKGD